MKTKKSKLAQRGDWHENTKANAATFAQMTDDALASLSVAVQNALALRYDGPERDYYPEGLFPTALAATSEILKAEEHIQRARAFLAPLVEACRDPIQEAKDEAEWGNVGLAPNGQTAPAKSTDGRVFGPSQAELAS